jgi:hypothetical protein
MAARVLTKHGELGRGRNRGDNVTSTRGSSNVDYLTARVASTRLELLSATLFLSRPCARGFY